MSDNFTRRMTRAELLQACAIVAPTMGHWKCDAGADQYCEVARDLVDRARALLSAVDAACDTDPDQPIPYVSTAPRSLWRTGLVKTKDNHIFRDPDDPGSCWLEAGDPSVDSGCEWLRIADLDGPARPDPVPLLRRAYQAMSSHTEDMLREHGCRETAEQLRSAADAIAAAYPEVTK